jgi:hypothetical protein
MVADKTADGKSSRLHNYGMSKLHWFILGQATWLLAFCSVLVVKIEAPVKSDSPPRPIAQAPAQVEPYRFPAIPLLPPVQPIVTDPELVGVHVPIPKEMRVYNRSGSQCVWCTIEMLGNYNRVPQVYKITDAYKHRTGPAEVKRVLEGKKVKFHQTMRRDEDMLEEYVMRRKLGAGVGVNHGSHCILVCHFDRAAKVVKVIDNGDPQLRIRTMTLDQFRRIWSDWVLVILPNDYPTTMGATSAAQDGDPVWEAWWNSRR